MYKKLSLGAVAALAIIFASSAKAAEESQFLDDPTFYAGLSVGQASLDTGISVTGTSSLDEEDTGFKVFGGVNLNKIFSVELYYADFGEASLSGKVGDVISLGGVTGTLAVDVDAVFDANSIGLVPVVGYDVTDYLRPFAKLGIHRYEVNGSVIAGTTEINPSDTGIDLVFGGGAMVKATNNIGFRAEFERYQFDDFDVDYLSVGAVYTF